MNLFLSSKPNKLHWLIVAKYGIHKLAIGYELVARWLRFANRHKKLSRKWTANDVSALCVKDKESALISLTALEANELKTLFALTSIDDLLN